MARTPITSASTAWWATSRRRVFYDAHTPDWADPHQRDLVPEPGFEVLALTNPQADLRLMAEAGVDSAVLFAKCQYGNAYYPTEVGYQHSALRGRDLFGEQVTAAHEHGIRVIAYYSNMWDSHVAGANPDWMLVPSPERGSTGRWPALCLLGPYRQYALEQVRELARRYPIDGLWSDILTAGPCVCERCESAFREVYGRAMPERRDDEHWIDLIHFAQKVLRDYLAEQREVLKAERPDAALIPNFYATTFVDATIGLTTEQLALADIGSSEGYTDWHGLGFPSFAASYISAGVQGRPSEVLVSRFVHTWDFTLRSEAQLRFEAFTVAAHGSAVSVDDQPYATGAIEPEVYRRLAPVFGRVAERERWIEGARAEPYAALYASQRSRELESLLGSPENPSTGEQSAQFPPSERRDAPSDLAAAVTGSYRALVESHLPVAFLDERAGTLQRLADFRVLLLPDVLSLGEAEIEAIVAYVHNGGGLVVTGELGVRDEHGRPTEMDARLATLLGVRFAEPVPHPFPFVQLGGELVGLGPWPLPHYGRIPSLELLADDVRVLATRTDPVLDTEGRTFWHNNQPAPGRPTDDPVIVERQVGAGRVIVSAARLGNQHARLGHGSYRDLLATLARRAADAEPAVTVEGSHRNTELVLSRWNDELVAHLVTGAPVARLDVYGTQQPAAVEDVARGASIVLQGPPDATKAWRIVAGDGVTIPIEGGRVQVEDFDDWETIVFGFSS